MGRNPCCSGPTASTVFHGIEPVYAFSVAIPVVVDLLLRRGYVLSLILI